MSSSLSGLKNGSLGPQNKVRHSYTSSTLRQTDPELSGTWDSPGPAEDCEGEQTEALPGDALSLRAMLLIHKGKASKHTWTVSKLRGREEGGQANLLLCSQSARATEFRC